MQARPHLVADPISGERLGRGPVLERAYQLRGKLPCGKQRLQHGVGMRWLERAETVQRLWRLQIPSRYRRRRNSHPSIR